MDEERVWEPSQDWTAEGGRWEPHELDTGNCECRLRVGDPLDKLVA